MLLNRLKYMFTAGVLLVGVISGGFAEKVYCEDENKQIYEVVQDESVNWPNPATEPNGKSAILMEKDTKAIVYGKNINEKLYPASITKIMTALLAVEKLNLTDTITFTGEMLEGLPYDAARQGVVAGETMTVEDCLYSLLLRSNNDIGVALAYVMAGSEEEFGKMMTDRAKEMGAVNTNFVNSTGLHDENHYTTAYDMAVITAEAMNNPTFAKIWSTSEYTLSATNITESFSIWHRHNMLVEGRVDYYPFATGGKTGYTDQAGRTLVTSAKNEGTEYIAVIMYTTNELVFNDTKELFNYGFSNFRKVSIKDNEIRFGLANDNAQVVDRIYGGDIAMFTMGEGEAIVPVNENISNLSYKVDMTKTNEKGHVAKITYTYNGNEIGSASVYVSEIYNSGTVISSSLEKYTEKKEKAAPEEIFSINIYLICAIIVVIIVIILILRAWIRYVKRRKIGKRYYIKRTR